MRLISCYIKGFGKYTNRQFDFDGGITAFCDANGSGKSTLADFIEAMFYNMDGNPENASKFSKRKHYIPFDGEQYGGSITFEYNGRTYILEKNFEKGGQGRSDKFRVTCGGIETTEFGKCPGEAIFGVDRGSFEHTMFVTSEGITLSPTDSIKTKLNGFVEGGDGGVKLDDAINRLIKKNTEYTKKSGLINRQKDIVSDYSEKLDKISDISRQLPQHYRNLEAMERELADITKESEEAHSQNTLSAMWNTYEGYVEDAKAEESAMANIESRYPRGVPDVDEAKGFSEESNRLKNLEAAMSGSSFTEQDERSLQRYASEFRQRRPDGEYMSELYGKVQKEGELASAVKNAEGRRSSRYDGLGSKFEANPPKNEDLKNLDDLAREYSLLSDAIDASSLSADAYMPSDDEKNNSRGFGSIVLLVLAAIFVIAGVICFFPDISVGVPIALIAAGVVLLFLAGFLYLNKRISSGGGVVYDSAETRENKRKLEECQSKIGAIIMPYGYSFEHGVVGAVEIFKRDYYGYKSAADEAAELNRSMEESTREREECRAWLDAAFSQFSLDEGTYVARYYQLQSDVAAYNGLEERKADFNSKSADKASEYEATKRSLEAFRTRYGLPANSDPDKVYTDTLEYRNRKKSHAEKQNKAESYKAANNLTAKPEGKVRSSVELETLLKELNRKISDETKKIADFESETEKEDYYLSEKERNAGLRDEYERRADIMSKTMGALKAASNALKKKYINPVGDRFVEYANRLEALTGEHVFLDDNMNVQFMHDGAVKEEGYMSDGQKSICMLCFRMAMIDNMYGVDKPFLVMDDPFTTFDPRHMELARQLIRDISKDHQIIYFTCHESRRI